MAKVSHGNTMDRRTPGVNRGLAYQMYGNFIKVISLTLGPHLSFLVTQQISVRQYEHLTQSQPHFLSKMT